MNAIQQNLDRLAHAKLSTVVHVHPTEPEIVFRYLDLAVQRVAFVCADPDVAQEIRRLSGDRGTVEVLETAVSQTAGTVQWQRFNVHQVDGQLQPSGLRTYYPRLALQESIPVPAATLASVLGRFNVAREDGECNLLVLETPGQEPALLEQLPAETLRLFDAMLIRGVRDGLYERASPYHIARQWLHDCHYRLAAHDGEDDPLWPCTLMQYDAHAAERAALLQRVQALEAQVEGRSKEHQARLREEAKAREQQAALLAQRDEHLKAAKQLLTQAQDCVRQLQDDLDRMARLRDEQAERAQLAEAQLREKEHDKAHTEKLVNDKQVLIEQLLKVRDEQTELVAEKQERIAQLESELADVFARQGILQEELVKAEAHVELISDLVLRESLQ